MTQQQPNTVQLSRAAGQWAHTVLIRHDDRQEGFRVVRAATAHRIAVDESVQPGPANLIVGGEALQILRASFGGQRGLFDGRALRFTVGAHFTNQPYGWNSAHSKGILLDQVEYAWREDKQISIGLYGPERKAVAPLSITAHTNDLAVLAATLSDALAECLLWRFTASDLRQWLDELDGDEVFEEASAVSNVLAQFATSIAGQFMWVQHGLGFVCGARPGGQFFPHVFVTQLPVWSAMYAAKIEHYDRVTPIVARRALGGLNVS